MSLALAMFSLFVGAAGVSAATVGVPAETTLDACGYFIGYQTPSHVYTYQDGGVTYTAEYGTWVGVWNNYSHIPVASVSPVTGSYLDAYSIDAAGNIRGVEYFRSAKGNIQQRFARTSGQWTVSVVATDQLAFLTSDTSGHCYTGPVPRL
jgi:hypothetical protein